MSSQPSYQSGSTSKVGKRRAAPYGQACLHCFKTKAKCVRQDNVDSCERCLRLNKQCCSADSLRKRASQKPSDAAALIANLEAKVDSLNTLLHDVVDSSASPTTLREALEERQPEEGKGKETVYEKKDLPLRDQTSNNSNDWRLSPDQEQIRLSIFRDRMLPFLAFMELPSDLTAQRLHEKRPLLFRAIMAVTSPSVLEKRARGNELKKLLAQKTWEGIETSLDLLLCVLTYLGWGYDTFVNKLSTSSPSRLTQIAMAVACDLRVNISGPKGSYLFPKEVMVLDKQTRNTRTPPGPDQQNLENMRAILGCFLLSSMTATHYRRIEPMRWSPQMEEYLGTISRTKGCMTDEMFSLQIRLQVLVQQVSEQRDQRELERYQATATLTRSISSEPLLNRWHLEVLQRKLHDITASIPPYLKDNEIILSQLYYSSLSIYETIQPANPDTESSASSLSLTSMLDERDCHYHSLQAIRSFFDNLSRFSSLNWAGFPFPFWAQSIRCTAVLMRLSAPPNHRDEVRSTVDLLTVVDWISERIKGAAVEVGETAPEDLFETLYRIAKGLRTYIIAKLDPLPDDQQVPLPFGETSSWNNSGSDSGVDMGTVDPTQLLMMQWLGFTDPTTAGMSFSAGSNGLPDNMYYGYN
ncbi:hypothetical protein BJX76DRAFT_126509 [Aspergillus varians]